MVESDSGNSRNTRHNFIDMRRIFPNIFLVYIVITLVATLVYAVIIGNVKLPTLAAMGIGGLVGAVELLSRYRHAPFRAVFTLPGVFYIVINVTASWAAIYMLRAFEVFSGNADAIELKQVIFAGLGSLAVMRSSGFKFKIGDSDIGIGPAAILDALLLVADRGVDRREAVERARDVVELVAQVRDPHLVARMLTKYSLALMQNVDSTTSQQLSESINKIMSDNEVPDPIKIDIVALQLGVVVGPEVLEAAVAALGDRLTANPEERTSRGVPWFQRKPLHPDQSGSVPIVPSVSELKEEIERSET